MVVQVGQCGNQIGDELFHQLSMIHCAESVGSSPTSRAAGVGDRAVLGVSMGPGSPPHGNTAAHAKRVNSTFFTRDGFARCVLIDSEPKVVQGVHSRHRSIIRPENVVHGQSGRGNNWGLGYFGVNDPRYIKKRHEPMPEMNSKSTSRGHYSDVRREDAGSGGQQNRVGKRGGVNNEGRNSYSGTLHLQHGGHENGSHRAGRRNGRGLGRRGEEEGEDYGEQGFQRNPLPADSRQAFKNLHKSQRIQDDGLFARALQAIYNETRRTADIERDEENGLEVEEGFESIILLHSLSGGTGSGLASRLAERIRLYFVQPPKGAPDVDEVLEDRMRQLDGLDGCLWMEKRRAKYLISIALAPMSVGEVATQSINAALTLQLLLRYTDAVLLLRNDDLLSEDEAVGVGRGGDGDGGPRSTIRTLIPACITFKEMNEVFVALLLPLFHYGHPCCAFTSERGGGGRTRTGRGGRRPSLCSAGVEAIVNQVAPPGCRQTGQNILLTLLPTPQRVYGRFRGHVHRCRFYGLYGGKEFLPGCRPEPPDASVLLSRHASDRHHWLAGGNGAREADDWNRNELGVSKGDDAGAWMMTLRDESENTSPHSPSTRGNNNNNNSGAQGEHNKVGGGTRGRVLVRRPLWQSVEPRPAAGRDNRTGWRDPNDTSEADDNDNVTARDNDLSDSNTNANSSNGVGREIHEGGGGDLVETTAAVKGKGSCVVSSSLPSLPSSGGVSQKRPSRLPPPASRASDKAEAGKWYRTLVYDCVSVQVPPALRQYYSSARRSPIASFLEKVEGVALLNQARELSGSLLFPLLRSVAFKVKVGAYMSIYEEVGITPARIEQAYQMVAEALLNAEELE